MAGCGIAPCPTDRGCLMNGWAATSGQHRRSSRGQRTRCRCSSSPMTATSRRSHGTARRGTTGSTWAATSGGRRRGRGIDLGERIALTSSSTGQANCGIAVGMAATGSTGSARMRLLDGAPASYTRARCAFAQAHRACLLLSSPSSCSWSGLAWCSPTPRSLRPSRTCHWTKTCSGSCSTWPTQRTIAYLCLAASPLLLIAGSLFKGL